MASIGPFSTKIRVDEQYCVHVDIFHINTCIDSIDLNLCIEQSGWQGIPFGSEEKVLLSWLEAGERNFHYDLQQVRGGQDYRVHGYMMLEKEVKAGNTSSARINVPPSWHGLRVMVIALDPLHD